MSGTDPELDSLTLSFAGLDITVRRRPIAPRDTAEDGFELVEAPALYRGRGARGLLCCRAFCFAPSWPGAVHQPPYGSRGRVDSSGPDRLGLTAPGSELAAFWPGAGLSVGWLPHSGWLQT